MEIDGLSIQEKIGQMVMVGINSNCVTKEVKALIQDYKVGGLILYRKNFSTYEQMITLIKQLRELNRVNKIPLFIAIDQEGGRVNRMPQEILNLPSAHLIANKMGLDGVKKSGEIIGKILRKNGFNLNFAPVLDIKRFEDSHGIGDRCYGDNKDDVTKYGVAFMKELQKQGIVSVIKHFPGHGATKKDSHFFLPKIKDNIKKLQQEDMYPFGQAVANGADSVLVGHLVIKNETKKLPASLSRRFITKYLRKEYRYRGLIITDDLKMGAISLFYGTNSAVKKAFGAGNDIVVFRFTPEKEMKIINEIKDLVIKGNLKENRINKSVKRIINIKQKYEISDEEEIGNMDIDEINKQIREIKEKCL